MVKHIIVIVGLFSLLTGCAKKKGGLNVPFELKINQSAVVSVNGSSINVKFIQLVEESRCPPNVECIWAGRVAIKLKINNSEEFIIGLNHSNYPSTFNYMNREYALLDVNYTNEASFGIENKCVVKLEVK